MSEVQIALEARPDITELAEFARATFLVANQHEIEEADLLDHLNSAMSDEQFARMALEDEFYMARVGGGLVGFGQLGQVSETYEAYVPEFDGNDAELRRLYVSADQQNLGIGSRLIRAVFSSEFLLDRNQLFITTWETNRGARRLYERFGFNKVGEMPDYNSHGELDGYEQVLVRPIKDL